MSVRIYTSPGNIIFPRPPVLRQYVPARVSRQVRYTRSLSTPLGLEKEFTYAPWEGTRRDFTNSLFETKRRDFSNNHLETKSKELITPLSPLSESKQKDFISSLWETKTIPLSPSKRRDFFNSPLAIRQRELTIPSSESKRRDFTNSHLENNRRDLANSYLETKRRDLTDKHLENNRRDLGNSYLDIKRRDHTNNHLENSIRNLTENSLDSKRRDIASNHLENNRRDLTDRCFEAKGKDSTINDLETRSRTLIESPRANRWWHKEKKNLCTPDDLLGIIVEPTGHYELPTDPCNEVYPGIILSDGPTALCTSMLKRMGVSHVLNAAQGKERPGQVNTSPSFYSHSRIRYLGVEAFDHIAFRLYPYFDEASDFIQEALDSGGKVLVHCRAGISRSATLVCAFLMLKRRLSAQEAIRTVRKNRPIIPNDGFLQQLCDLNERLHKTRCP